MRSARVALRAGALSALIMALLAGPASAAPLADWPDIQGRWREDVQPNGPIRILKLGVLEIAPCGEASLCGRRIHPDGTCGEIVLRVSRAAEGGPPDRTVTIGGRTMKASARTEDGELVVRAFPAAANPLSRRILPVVSTFQREGPARCADGVS